MKTFPYLSLTYLLGLAACSLSLDLPPAVGSGQTLDGGPPTGDAGAQDCEAIRFREDHPWAQEAGAQLFFVAAGASGSGASADDPMGALPAAAALPEGRQATVLLAPGRYDSNLNLKGQQLKLVGACASTVDLLADGAPIVTLADGALSLAHLSLSGDAGQKVGSNAVPRAQGLISVSGTTALTAQDVNLTSSATGHGLQLGASGAVALENLSFGAIAGSAIVSLRAGGEFLIQDSSFLGPIGHDGISIIDFGGSGFRVTGSSFAQIGGNALGSQEALGSWTVEDNTFLGPIGHDGISIIDFGGSGFRIAGNSVSEVNGTGLMAQKALGSWTVEDNTFLGPIGHDGIAIEGFHGESLSISGNSLAGMGGMGIRLARTANTSVSSNSIESPGGRGIHAESCVGEAGDSMSFAGNTVNGALEAGLSLLDMGVTVAMEGNRFNNSRNPEAGGDQVLVPVGTGILALDSGRLSLSNNTLTGNASHALLVDLHRWGNGDNPELSGPSSLSISGTVRDEGEALTVYFPPEGLEVTGDDGAQVTSSTPAEATDRVYSGNRGCGDGNDEPLDEECDDGNLLDGDGCSARCQLETDRVQVVAGKFNVWMLGHGQLWGQGQGLMGQLGRSPAEEDGKSEDMDLPILTPGIEYLSLVSGPAAQHAILIRTDGTAYSWGSNQHGQLGRLSGQSCAGAADCDWALEPEIEISSVRLATAGTNHSCFVGWKSPDPQELRAVYCVGGTDPTLLRGDPLGGEEVSEGEYLKVEGLPDLHWDQLGAGQVHSCALSRSGTIWCWGRNDELVLADDNPNQTGPVAVELPDEVKKMSVGQAHTCALTWRGSVYCWGSNGFGQLGIDTQTEPQSEATLLNHAAVAGSTLSEVAAGGNHTCVLSRAGLVTCFGRAGLLGVIEGTENNSAGPPFFGRPWADGDPLLPILSLRAGEAHSCAQDSQGSWHCWGENVTRQVRPEQPICSPREEGDVCDEPQPLYPPQPLP